MIPSKIPKRDPVPNVVDLGRRSLSVRGDGFHHDDGGTRYHIAPSGRVWVERFPGRWWYLKGRRSEWRSRKCHFREHRSTGDLIVGP